MIIGKYKEEDRESNRKVEVTTTPLLLDTQPSNMQSALFALMWLKMVRRLSLIGWDCVVCLHTTPPDEQVNAGHEPAHGACN